MSFFSFGNKKSKGDLSLVFHIGSSTVSAALFEHDENKKPIVLFSIREQILLARRSGEANKLLAGMIQTLDLVVHHIMKNGLSEVHGGFFHPHVRKVSNIGIVLSGAWCSSKTKFVTVNAPKDSPIQFNAAFIESINEKEKNDLEKELSTYRGDKTADEKLQVFEQKIIQTKLNGYEIPHPFGKKAVHLELAMIMSVAPALLMEKIKKVIGQHFHPDKFTFHSFSLASFAVIRDLQPQMRDFLLLHVSGELTDVSIVKNGVTNETISFPLGISPLLRNLSKAMRNAPIEAVRSALQLYFDKKAEKEISEKIEKVLADFEKDWLQVFNDATTSFSKESSMPPFVCLVTQPLYQKLFEGYASRAQAISFGQLSSPFTVTAVTDQMLEPHCRWQASIPFDRAPAIDLLFMDSVNSN
jgi:cell division ATPase FtsA